LDDPLLALVKNCGHGINIEKCLVESNARTQIKVWERIADDTTMCEGQWGMVVEDDLGLSPGVAAEDIPRVFREAKALSVDTGFFYGGVWGVCRPPAVPSSYVSHVSQPSCACACACAPLLCTRRARAHSRCPTPAHLRTFGATLSSQPCSQYVCRPLLSRLTVCDPTSQASATGSSHPALRTRARCSLRRGQWSSTARTATAPTPTQCPSSARPRFASSWGT
jgi:hypothetical protein